MSYPDNATASLAQFLFRDSQGAMYIIPRRAFHNGSQYGDTVTIVQDLSGNGNDLTGTAVFDRKPFFYVTDQESLDNIRDAQIIRDVDMAAPVGNLGPGCTVVRAEPGLPVEFDELEISGNYQVTEDFSILIIIDRALAESEVRVIEEMGEKWGGATFNPLVSYANGGQGVYLAPWDISTLWQDEERTVPVENYGDPVRVMDDLSPNGNHATAPTSAARGTYGRMPAGVGIRNLLTQTENLLVWGSPPGETEVADGIGDPDGGNNAFRIEAISEDSGLLRLSSDTLPLDPNTDYVCRLWIRSVAGAKNIRVYLGGTESIATTISDEWQQITIPVTSAASSSTIFQFRLRDPGKIIDVYQPSVMKADNIGPYQRVGNQYDVSQEGVTDVYYIETDGIDDGYQTAPIDLTMYDSTSLAAGVQWLRNTNPSEFIVEFSAHSGQNPGVFSLFKGNIADGWGFRHGGTDAPIQYPGEFADNDPHILSLSGNIAESLLLWGVDSASGQFTQSQGTGTLGDYRLNLLGRNTSSNLFQGRFFGAIIVHPRSPYEEQNRQFLAKKAGVTL